VRRIVVIATLLVAAASCAPAATGALPVPMPVAYGTGSIVGEVRDTVSGLPIVRADICTGFNAADGRPIQRCVNPDTLGYFEMTGLPAGTMPLAASCPGLRGELSRKFPYRATLVLETDTRRRWDIRTDATGCDMRPFTVRTGTFTGIYHAVFEGERFVSCDRTVRAAPSFTEADWERMRKAHGTPPPFVMAFAMTVDGTVRGPAQYGHGGMSAYKIDVARIRHIRSATVKDCLEFPGS